MQFQSLMIGLGLGLFQLGANGLPGKRDESPSKPNDQTSSANRIPKISMDSGIWMVPDAGVSCGIFEYSKTHIYQKGELACAEKNLMEKNPTVKLVSNGEIHRTHSRFDSKGQKFYIYPLSSVASGGDRFTRPTPYVVVTLKCQVMAVYLRTFLKSKPWEKQKSKYDKCWDGRNPPDRNIKHPSSPKPGPNSNLSSQNLRPSIYP